jgi:hypothetical protein
MAYCDAVAEALDELQATGQQHQVQHAAATTVHAEGLERHSRVSAQAGPDVMFTPAVQRTAAYTVVPGTPALSQLLFTSSSDEDDDHVYSGAPHHEVDHLNFAQQQLQGDQQYASATNAQLVQHMAYDAYDALPEDAAIPYLAPLLAVPQPHHPTDPSHEAEPVGTSSREASHQAPSQTTHPRPQLPEPGTSGSLLSASLSMSGDIPGQQLLSPGPLRAQPPAPAEPPGGTLPAPHAAQHHVDGSISPEASEQPAGSITFGAGPVSTSDTATATPDSTARSHLPLPSDDAHTHAASGQQHSPEGAPSGEPEADPATPRNRAVVSMFELSDDSSGDELQLPLTGKKLVRGSMRRPLSHVEPDTLLAHTPMLASAPVDFSELGSQGPPPLQVGRVGWLESCIKLCHKQCSPWYSTVSLRPVHVVMPGVPICYHCLHSSGRGV